MRNRADRKWKQQGGTIGNKNPDSTMSDYYAKGYNNIV